MKSKTNQCPDFPYFGATYPDARCIDGFLWDLDKCTDEGLYGGGEEPCPFCNSETIIEQDMEEGEFTREELELERDKLWAKYGYTPPKASKP